METPCLEVNLSSHKTWVRVDWEGKEVLRGSLPPLESRSLDGLEALLDALSRFFPTPLSIVFVVDAWGASSAPPFCANPNALHAAQDCPEGRRERRRAARVTP